MHFIENVGSQSVHQDASGQSVYSFGRKSFVRLL